MHELSLCEAIADELGDIVQLSTPVEKIYVDDGTAVGVRAGGFDQPTSAVISTAPIGRPPASGLASVTMSGTTPICS